MVGYLVIFGNLDGDYLPNSATRTSREDTLAHAIAYIYKQIAYYVRYHLSIRDNPLGRTILNITDFTLDTSVDPMHIKSIDAYLAQIKTYLDEIHKYFDESFLGPCEIRFTVYGEGEEDETLKLEIVKFSVIFEHNQAPNMNSFDRLDFEILKL